MKSITNLLAGLLLTGVLVFAPSNSFARGGGGGGGHFGGGGHMGAFHGGFSGGGRGAVAHGFHGGGSHHRYPGSYGYFGPFEYGLDDDAGFYDDSDSPDLQPPANDGAPDQSTSLIIMSVQNELARLGYYRGPIDGVAGSETGRAVRWFQTVDHLPVTGEIDSATREALGAA
jgi:hypothetical protein